MSTAPKTDALVLDSELARTFDLMGHGWRLRVPKNGDQPTLENLGSAVETGALRRNVSTTEAQFIAAGKRLTIKTERGGGISVWARHIFEQDGADWYALGY